MPIHQEAKSYSHSLSDFSYNPNMDHARLNLIKVVAERDISLTDLSKAAGKNHAYLQQFVKRHVPMELPERVRNRVAELLGIPEAYLRPDAPILGTIPDTPPDSSAVEIARKRKRRGLQEGEVVEIDVRGGLGPGGLAQEIAVEGEVIDAVRTTWRMPLDFLRSELRSREADLEIFPVDGDSMMPTLMPGDRVMVNRVQNTPSTDGLYAIGGPFGVQVKRLEYVLGSKEPVMIRVISDNTLHSSATLSVDELHIIGRVVCRISRM